MTKSNFKRRPLRIFTEYLKQVDFLVAHSPRCASIYAENKQVPITGEYMELRIVAVFGTWEYYRYRKLAY